MNTKKDIDNRLFRYLLVMYKELKHKLENRLLENGISDFLQSSTSRRAVSEMINDDLGKIQKDNPDFNCEFGEDFFKNLAPLEHKEVPKKTPRDSNLETLVKYLGYRNWNVFKEEVDKRFQTDLTPNDTLINEIGAQTSLFDPDDLNVLKMKPGEEVTIGWYDDYYVKARYKGCYEFEVIDVSDSINRKKGETFLAKSFKIHYIMHFKEITDKTGNKHVVSGFPRLPYISIIKPTQEEISELKNK